MPRWQKLERHDALIHRYKEAVRNAIAYACPRLMGERASVSTSERPPAGMEPLEPRLLLSGTVSGTVFADTDADHVYQSGSDTLLQGWRVFVDEDTSGEWEPGEGFDTTNANGMYSLLVDHDVPHTIIAENPNASDGWAVTDPGASGHTITVGEDQTDSGNDFAVATASISGPTTVGENVLNPASYTLNLSAPGLNSPVWDIVWGDGGSSLGVAGTVAQYQYLDGPETHTITATATDGQDSSIVIDAAPLQVNVQDVAPMFHGLTVDTGHALQPLLQGISADYTLQILEPGQDPITQVVVDWDDESSNTTLINPPGGGFISIDLGAHIYHDPGTFNPTFTVTTDDSGPIVMTTSVVVGDVIPDLSGQISSTSVLTGEVVTLDVTASYPVALDDTVTDWQVDWGDGFIQELPATELSGSFAHIYDTADSYAITVKAKDSDGQWSILSDDLNGDLTGDGFVGLDDLDIVLNNWSSSVTPGDLSKGDLDGDGFIGLGDLDIVLNNWNKQAFSFDIQVAAGAGVDPIVVDTPSDQDVVQNGLSLREALALAASHPGPDTITFDPTVNNIILGLGELLIEDDVSVLGLGTGQLTIAGSTALGEESRVFNVSSGVTATIDGMTIRNGHALGPGGGILNAGHLTLNDVVLTNNTADTYGGGVFTSDGSLTISNSSITDNVASGNIGGGIYVYNCALTVSDSTIDGNTALTGAGLYLTGSGATAGVSRSTISNNLGVNSAGGHGIYGNSYAGAQTYTNVTISGNEGDGIAWNGGDGVTLVNSTITDNRGRGFKSDFSSAYAYNSIIVGNNDTDLYQILTGSNNLIGSLEQVSASTLVPENQVNVDPADVKLAPLGYYGGSTQTHALEIGSLAIDAGDNAFISEATDQRGEDRIYHGTVDAGAVEQRFPVPTITGAVSTLQGADPYVLSLGYYGPTPTQWVIDWGDGQIQRVEGSPDTVSHVYGIDGVTHTVKAWAFDLDHPADDFSENTFVIEAESYYRNHKGKDDTDNSGIDASASDWGIQTDATASGGSHMAVPEDSPELDVLLNDIGARMDYAVWVDTPGTYYAWVRMKGASTTSDSVHIGVDGVMKSDRGEGMTDASTQWHWEQNANGTAVDLGYLDEGLHRVHVWMREDGTLVDRILLTTDTTLDLSAESGAGPDTTDLDTEAYAATPITVSVTERPDVTLESTIRDFKDSHVDFQIPASGLVYNLIETDLDTTDRKPDLNTSGTHESIDSAASFAQWYTDVSGINQSISFDMVLEPIGLNRYGFTDTSFFPIDDQLFGNEGRDNNYHFTLELHGTFTYHAGQEFEAVKSDDDLWIFINNTLLVDLGGVHPPEDGVFPLDSLGLTDGATYPFDLFFAERRTSLSNLVFETNIEDLVFAESDLILTEDQDMVTTDQTEHVTGQSASFAAPAVIDRGPIRIDFSGLAFDATSTSDVNDAFELALLDADGNPLIPTIGAGLDAFFNWSQGQSVLLADDVALTLDPGNTSGQIFVDLANMTGVAEGDPLTLVARLVNNDADDTTTVTIDFNIENGVPTDDTMPATTSNLLPDTPSRKSHEYISYSKLSDVSAGFEIDFKHTSYTPNTDGSSGGTLYTSVDITKTSQVQARGDLILTFPGLFTQDAASVVQSDAFLAAFDGVVTTTSAAVPVGTPYLILNDLMDSGHGGFYEAGQVIHDLLITFEHPGNDRFDFNPVILGQTNEAPGITSDPYAENRGDAMPVATPIPGASETQHLEVTVGQALRYIVGTSDPDGDPVNVSIIDGPSDAELIDSNNDGYTDTIEWTPAAGDVNTHLFRIRATDVYGLFNPANDQTFVVSVVDTIANRQPYFDSTPVIKAELGKPYKYDSLAIDPDGHTVNYTGSIGVQPKRYRIDLGADMVVNTLNNPDSASTVDIDYLIFFSGADAPANGLSVSSFSNIRLYEADWPGTAKTIQLSDLRIAPSGTPASNASYELFGANQGIRLEGGGFWGYELGSTYSVTENTILEFTFVGEVEGLTHGVSAADSLTSATVFRSFPVYGESVVPNIDGKAGFNNTYDDYSPIWDTTPDFEVDPTTGMVTWHNVPADLLGEWVHMTVVADDQQVPALSATQGYDVLITADQPPATPQAPIIWTESLPEHELSDTSNPAIGDVKVDNDTPLIDLDMDPDGSSVNKIITITMPSPEDTGTTIPTVLSDLLDSVKNPSTYDDLSILRIDPTDTVVDPDDGVVTDIEMLLQLLQSRDGTGVIIQDGSVVVSGHHKTGLTDSTIGMYANGSTTYNLVDDLKYGFVLSTGDVGEYGSGQNDTFGETEVYADNLDPEIERLMDSITGKNQTGPNYYSHDDATKFEFEFKMSGTDKDRIYFDVVWGSEEFEYFVNSAKLDGFGIYLFTNVDKDDHSLPQATLTLSHDTATTTHATHGTSTLFQSYHENIDHGPLEYKAELDTTFTWEDISTTGTALWGGGSTAEDDTVELTSTDLGGFNFTYLGEEYDSLYISSNGLITFDTADGIGSNVELFTYQHRAIAPFWDDLEVSTTGEVFWEVLDENTAAERLVVQWNNVSFNDEAAGADAITFQAVLYNNYQAMGEETVGDDIRFAYQDMTSSVLDVDGRSATVGLSGKYNDDRDALAYYNIATRPGFVPDSEHPSASLYSGSEDDYIGELPINVDHPQMHGELDDGTFTLDEPYVKGTELNAVIVPSQDVDGVVTSTETPVMRFEADVRYNLDSSDHVNRIIFVIADTDDPQRDSTAYISPISGVPFGPWNLDLISTDPSVPITVQASTNHDDVTAGSEVDFNVTIPVIDEPKSFDLQIVDRDHAGVVHGSVPVLVNQTYFTLIEATDPDGDDANLVYEFVGNSHGAAFVAGQPGVVSWNPTSTGTYPVTVRVTDEQGLTDEQDFVIEVLPINASNNDPVIDNLPLAETLDVVIGDPVTFTVEASQPGGDNDELYFYAANAPLTGFSLDSKTGVIEWTPSLVETRQIEIYVSDSRGGSDMELLSVSVTQAPVTVNTPPELTIAGPERVYAGQKYEATISVVNHENDKLTYTLSNEPQGLTISPDGTRLVWEPSEIDIDSHVFILSVSDGRGGSDAEMVVLDVLDPNLPPELGEAALPRAKAGLDQDTLTPGNQPYTYELPVSDPNNDPLVYEVDEASDALGISVVDGVLTWANPDTDPGVITAYPITVDVYDRRGGHDRRTYWLEVGPDAAPQFNDAEVDPVFLGEAWHFTVSAYDAEDGPSGVGSGMTFSIDDQSLARGITIDEQAGDMTWTPAKSVEQTVFVRVRDSYGNTSTADLYLPVNVRPPSNVAPTVTDEFIKPAVEGQEWTYTIVTEDENFDDVAIHLTSWPLWYSPTTQDGINTLTLTGIPSDIPEDGRLDEFEFTITDGVIPAPIEYGLPLYVFGNTPPFITSGVVSANLELGVAADLEVELIDPDGDDLWIELISPVPGTGSFSVGAAAINGEAFTGAKLSNVSDDHTSATPIVLSFTPDVAGLQQVKIRVTDSHGQSVDHKIDLDVYDPSTNAEPSITTRTKVVAGELYSAQVDFKDPANKGRYTDYAFIIDGSFNRATTLTDVTVGGESVPSGMAIDDQGRITWTPGVADIGDTFSYQVVVDTDGTVGGIDEIPLEVIELEVVERLVNHFPVIDDIEPMSSNGSEPISFLATATDQDGDPLDWSIVSGPDTATIKPDGRFTWLPGDDEYGKEQTVTIRVEDRHGGWDEAPLVLKADRTYIPGNSSPEIISEPLTPDTAGSWVYDITAKDDDPNDTIYFRLEGDPTYIDDPDFVLVDHGDGTATLTWSNAPDSATKKFSVVAEDDGGLAHRQIITVTMGTFDSPDGVVDTPPKFGADPTYSVIVGNTYTYDTSIIDPDGTPVVQFDVTLEVGGGAPTAAPSVAGDVITWTPNSSDVGVYNATVTVTEGGATLVRTYKIQVIDPAGLNAPVIQHEALTASLGESYQYDVKVTDGDNTSAPTFFLLNGDGNPVTAIDGLSISETGRVTWTVPEDYVPSDRSFEVIVTDADGLTDTNLFTITIVPDAAPTVTLSAPQRYPKVGDNVVFYIDASDDLGLSKIELVVTPPAGSGLPVTTLPVSKPGAFSYNFSDFTALTAIDPGDVYQVKARAYDTHDPAQSTDSATVNITFAVVDGKAPVLGLAYPLPGPVITKTVDLEGWIEDVDLDEYYVKLTPKDGGPAIWLANATPVQLSGIGSEENPVALATINPSLLSNGAYTLEAYAKDTEGRYSGVHFYDISIDSLSVGKLGNVVLSNTDLTTTVGGLPISIERMYDSYNAQEDSEFGYGWSFDLLEGKMEISGLVEGEFFRDDTFSAGLRYGSEITVRLPGGQSLGFTTVAVGYSNEYGHSLPGSVAIAFQPDGDSLGSKLEFTSGQQTTLDWDSYYAFGFEGFHDRELTSMPMVLDPETGQFYPHLTGVGGAGEFAVPFNPADASMDYKLTLPDGTVYTIDSEDGEVLSAIDPFGNTITFNGDIVAKHGDQEIARLQIKRFDGRITEIRTPDGDAVKYYYSETGDLIAFQDRTGRWTTYQYDIDSLPAKFKEEHILTSVTKYPNPLSIDATLSEIEGMTGIVVSEFTFADDGTLTTVEGASGISVDISYIYDGTSVGLPSGYTVEIVDNGETTTEIVRDADGRAVRRIELVSDNGGNADYIINVYEYDENDNLKIEWSPFGFNETGSNTERYTVSPVSKMTESTYDEHGRLLTETDAMGNATQYLDFDEQGNPRSIVDPLENITNVWYQGGNVTSTIARNPQGADERVGFDYDPLGNPEEITRQKEDGTNVVTGQYVYNEKSQLIQSTQTDPDGRLGTQEAVTRYYRYDALGNQIITYTHEADPDLGNVTLLTYTEFDAEGRYKANHQYTLSGHLDIQDASDLSGETPNTSTGTTYDGMGRIHKNTNSFGTATYTFYDMSGNVTETAKQVKAWNGAVEVSAWMVSRKVYDDYGRVIYTLDPQVVYDIADGTSYDADEHGPITGYGSRFIYDDLGRLVESYRVKELTLTSVVSAGVLVENQADITNMVDIAKSETGYDGQGRVEYTIDYNDYTDLTDDLRTDYYYDLNGRQIGELGPKIEVNSLNVRVLSITEYDAGGRQKYTTTGIAVTAASINNDPEHLAHPDVSKFFDTNNGYVALANLGDSGLSMVNTSRFEYDAFGRVIKTTHEGATGAADDIITETVYNALDRQAASIDPLQRQTDYEYDDAGRLTAVNLPEIEIDDPSGGGRIMVRPRYEYQYDENGRQTAIIDNAYMEVESGSIIYLMKDANGNDVIENVVGGSLPTRSTEFTYDGRGRQTSRELPDGQTEYMFYDDTTIAVVQAGTPAVSVGRGQVAYTVSFEGVVTEFMYDNRAGVDGRLVEARFYTAAQTATAGLTIDGSTTLAAIQTALSGVTPSQVISYTYDAFERQTKVHFDRNGNGLEDTGEVTTNVYDEFGRIVRIEAPEGAVNHAYNDQGQLIRTYTGDAIADLENYTPGTDDGVAVTDTEYQYDHLGRLSAVIVHERFDTPIGGAGEVNEYHYDLIGNLDYTALDNGVITDYIYDGHNRLDILRHFIDGAGGGGTAFEYDGNVIDTLLSEYDYTVDLAGNRKTLTETDAAGETTSFTWDYDALNRLIKEVRDTNATGQTDYVDLFSYDMVGNRLTKTHYDNAGETGDPDVTTYHYDNSDRLIREKLDNDDDGTVDEETVYTYDQTQQKTKKEYTGDEATGTLTTSTTFEYDQQGRLKQVVVNEDVVNNTYPNKTTTYTYNHEGVRVSEKVELDTDDSGSPNSTTTTRYVIDTLNHTGYTQVLEEGVDGNADGDIHDVGEVTKSYTLGHDVIGHVEDGVTPTVVYLLADGHGSTRQAADETGMISQHYAYDAYGNMLAGGNLTNFDSVTPPHTSLLYSGEWTHADGTQYLRARYYDPSSGRFNRLDPFAGNQHDPQSLHKYAYAHANPIMGTDPSGLMTLLEVLGAGVGFQSLEKIHSAQKKVAISSKTAKALVAITFVEMSALVRTFDKFEDITPLVLAYYGFLTAKFFKLYRGARSNLLAQHVPTITGYLAALQNGADELRRFHKGTYTGDITTVNFLPGQHKEIAATTWIVYTGKRDTDFRLAKAVNGGFKIFDVALDALQGDNWLDIVYDQAKSYNRNRRNRTGALLPGGAYTWHHHEFLGVMEYVVRSGHQDNSHFGAVAFYRVLTNKTTYKSKK